MKASNCCGAAPRSFNGDCDSSDLGICPSCKEHCEYEEQGEEDGVIARDFSDDEEKYIEVAVSDRHGREDDEIDPDMGNHS